MQKEHKKRQGYKSDGGVLGGVDGRLLLEAVADPGGQRRAVGRPEVMKEATAELICLVG